MIAAYRDSSKLVQRLRDKQTNTEEFILPEDLTKEFDDSLLLGCAAVQSQYDHDVRRFGETYARGDAVAREQMKDILITLQQAVISHLREVFMDEASLNLHALKETSDDCRVNATVCLGQLYQRMSTATAAVKQSHRPYIDEPDKVQLPGSLAYSSSRSTHSSFGGRSYDAQSATSYTTYSSRTAIGHDRKPSNGLTPQRRISMNSAVSYSSERDRDRPQSRTPGEDDVPALPFPMQRQASQGPLDSVSTGTGRFPSNIDLETSSNPASPPPYVANAFVHTTDDKGQKFPPGSSFYEPPLAQMPVNAPQVPFPPQDPNLVQVRNFSRAIQVHELDDNSTGVLSQSPDQTSSIESPRSLQDQPVPLNPEYSTLEYVASLESRSRPPAALAASAEYQQYMQSMNMQAQLRPQPLFSQGVAQQRQIMAQVRPSYSPPMQSPSLHGQYPPGPQYYTQPLQPAMNQSIARPPQSPPPQPYHHLPTGIQTSPRAQTGVEPTATADTVIDPLLQAKVSQILTSPTLQQTKRLKVPSIAASSRPLSIRSTGSTGSKIASFALRRALPPGIAEAINKPSPSPLEENSQPRYIKPKPLDLTVSGRSSPVGSPTSPIARHMDTLSLDEKPRPPSSNAPSLESTMRAAAPSPAMQVARSELNLPSEANLAGFCKGAVRQQLGSRKKGFGVENKKGGPKSGQEFCFKCTKCNFEGPAVVSAALPSGGRGGVKREKTMDLKVRVSPGGGIRYRWAFLAKSHLLNKTTSSDAANSNDMYGCYFCCAEGAAKGWLDDGSGAGVNAQLATLGTFGGNKPTAAAHTTPTFNGLKAFMAHLETHRSPARLPGLIAANEMNCIIGRVALDGEDFDLNLPPLAG